MSDKVNSIHLLGQQQFDDCSLRIDFLLPELPLLFFGAVVEGRSHKTTTAPEAIEVTRKETSIENDNNVTPREY